MALRVTFHGGAESVTGSNFLVEGKEGKILIDCGLEQGREACAECMYDPFAYDVSSIDALIITHAHLDHIGRAPKLMREGFKGKMYMTPPTRDLMEIMLRDSAGIMAMEAQKSNREPMFNDADIDALFDRYEPLNLHEERMVAPGLSVLLRATGHILGSASVRIKDEEGVTLVCTGDIGNTPSPLPMPTR
ncbi:MAG TPA: MBL fold metallo-hydrolase [Candidatus Paceibacterota bacterium]|nr:MBL fold metallo-hydrolase [Candidatus Paceibacterota bacterium]